MHWCVAFQLWRSSANVTLLTNNVPSTGLTSFYHEGYHGNLGGLWESSDRLGAKNNMPCDTVDDTFVIYREQPLTSPYTQCYWHFRDNWSEGHDIKITKLCSVIHLNGFSYKNTKVHLKNILGFYISKTIKVAFRSFTLKVGHWLIQGWNYAHFDMYRRLEEQ